MKPTAPEIPQPRLSLGITGHRLANPAMAANHEGVKAALAAIFARIEAIASEGIDSDAVAPVRLHSLLIDGVDQMAAEAALERKWQLVAPLPFGRRLDCAINALPETSADAEALLAGNEPADAAVAERARRLLAIGAQAHRFELAERDAEIADLYLARLRNPADARLVQAASFAMSERVALAGRVMIEQSDLVIGVWDGESTSLIGGTGATIAHSLELGTPVLWIDARAPENWRLLFAPEALAGIASAARQSDDRDAALARLIRDTLGRSELLAGRKHAEGPEALAARHWRARSPKLWHAYRRIEALFGEKGLRARFRNLRQTYAEPDAALAGTSGSELGAITALPGQDAAFAGKIATSVIRRFVWADGISAWLSDKYRGGMTLNFIFSALAIVGGVAYLPFATIHEKWMFSSFELALLLGILAITLIGQRHRWHGRWFETRRVAEYLRHAPLLIAVGVARPIGRWPKGTRSAWPEHYARHAIREAGLPGLSLTQALLHSAVSTLLLPYAASQYAYHQAKAERLSRTQHNLDRLSEGLFLLAIVSVASYLVMRAGGLFDHSLEELALSLSPFLTFCGVMLPTFGAGIAGLRYFGDFERFAAISEVTAERLEAVIARLKLLADCPAGAMDYARVSDLAHAIDDIVVDEIESWQAVFAGKHVTVPV